MRAAQRGMDEAALADERYRAVLESLGTMAGDVRGQEFEEQADVARAKDIINKFNVQQRTAQDVANVEAMNTAQQLNLAEQQRVADANVLNRQEEARREAEARAAVFEMEKQRLAGESGMAEGVASAHLARGDAATQGAQGTLTAGGSFLKGVGSLGGFMATPSDERVKENVEPLSDEEARELMGRMTGYKYNYKPGMGLEAGAGWTNGSKLGTVSRRKRDGYGRPFRDEGC